MLKSAYDFIKNIWNQQRVDRNAQKYNKMPSYILNMQHQTDTSSESELGKLYWYTERALKGMGGVCEATLAETLQLLSSSCREKSEDQRGLMGL